MMGNDDLILKAVRLALDTHKEAKRKFSNKPYISHPLRVMGQVAAHPQVTCLEVAAAVLHDTHEDPPYLSLKVIEEQIHPQVAAYVSHLTNASKVLMLEDGTYPKEWPRPRRKQLNFDKLKRCDYWTQTIKAYDRVDNLEELSTDLHSIYKRPSKDFLEMYCRESLDLVASLDKIDDWLQARLRRTISILQSLIAPM